MSFEANYGADAHFDDFLHTLGTALDPSDLSTGSLDHIQAAIRSCAVIYDSTCLSELVFLVPSLRLEAPGVSLVTHALGLSEADRRGRDRRPLERPSR